MAVGPIYIYTMKAHDLPLFPLTLAKEYCHVPTAAFAALTSPS